MARPKIKDTRRAQILDAFEICVAKFGVEGTTLAKTAEQAGLARPLVRHNIGNREELVDALVERFVQKSKETMNMFIAALPPEGKAKAAVEWLFDPQYSDAQLVQVAYALITHSADDAALARKMQSWVTDFAQKLTTLIADDYTHAEPEKITAAATGIMGIYFNVESLGVLGTAGTLTAASKKAALMLLMSLENNE